MLQIILVKFLEILEIVIFRYCAPFTDCISEINNAKVDNAKDTDVVRPMYTFME